VGRCSHAQFVGRLLQPLASTRADGDVTSFGDQRTRAGKSQSATAPGDNRDLACEL
jgi:uncharacterized membrane protein